LAKSRGNLIQEDFIAYQNGAVMSLPDEVNDEMQQNTLSRLKKIEGQVRGLHGMVSHNRRRQLPICGAKPTLAFVDPALKVFEKLLALAGWQRA
jgi:hypothetical protein